MRIGSRSGASRVLGTLALAAASAGAAAAAAGPIAINEIQYTTSGAPASALFEYVELFNASGSAVNVTGWTLADGSSHLFTLPTLVLPPQGFVVVLSSAADGVVTEDTDPSDGSARFVAGADWPADDLANAGDAVQLRDAIAVLRDFVYYDEVNAGDAFVDLEAVAAGLWKSGAAIDTLLSATTGRAIALVIDGAQPNETGAAPDAEDLDWMQYSLADSGTPGTWNDPLRIFSSNFENGFAGWTDAVGD